MPHIVELDLTPSDFRQFYSADEIKPAEGSPVHWLLSAVYGRDLLKAKLRKVRPDLAVPNWRHAPNLDPMLDEMVDELGLRGWAQPTTFNSRIRYLKIVLTMMVAVENGQPLPTPIA